MTTTILLLVGLILDVGIGAAAYKHAHKVEDKLDRLDARVEKLEVR